MVELSRYGHLWIKPSRQNFTCGLFVHGWGTYGWEMRRASWGCDGWIGA